MTYLKFQHSMLLPCPHMNDLQLSLGLHKRQKELSSLREEKDRGKRRTSLTWAGWECVPSLMHF